MKQRRRAEHGGKGGDAGKDGGAIIEEYGQGDGDQADRGDRFPKPAPPQRRHRAERQQPAREQFPGAGGQQIEGEAAGVAFHPYGQQQRGGGYSRQRGGAPARGMAREQHQQDGKADIILLLHRQRPCVEQRLHVRAAGEIAGVGEEPEIGREQRRRQRRARHAFQIAGQIEPGGKRQRDQDHQGERRDDPAKASLIEADEGKAPLVDVAGQDAGDQKARYDEEDVDADIAARKAGNMGVEQKDRQDGESAQAVDVAPVAMRMVDRRHGCWSVHGSPLPAKPCQLLSPAATIASDATGLLLFAFARNCPLRQKGCAFQASSPKNFRLIFGSAFFLSPRWAKRLSLMPRQ